MEKLTFSKEQFTEKLSGDEIMRRSICLTMNKNLTFSEKTAREGEMILEMIETGSIKDGSEYDDAWAWVKDATQLKDAIQLLNVKIFAGSHPHLLECTLKKIIEIRKIG